MIHAIIQMVCRKGAAISLPIRRTALVYFRAADYSRCDLKGAGSRLLDAGIQVGSTGQQELKMLSVVLSNFGGTFLDLL